MWTVLYASLFLTLRAQPAAERMRYRGSGVKERSAATRKRNNKTCCLALILALSLSLSLSSWLFLLPFYFYFIFITSFIHTCWPDVRDQARSWAGTGRKRPLFWPSLRLADSRRPAARYQSNSWWRAWTNGGLFGIERLPVYRERERAEEVGEWFFRAQEL